MHNGKLDYLVLAVILAAIAFNIYRLTRNENRKNGSR